MTEASTPRERRQYVRFAFFRVDPAWRQQSDLARAAATAEFIAAVEHFNGRMLLRSYSLVGYRGDTDLLFWQVTDDLHVLHDFAARLNQTTLARFLQPSYTFLSLTRRSIYDIREINGEETDRTIIVPGPAKFLFVYPFVKTRPWYALTKAERQTMMDEHIRVGRRYPTVKLNTTYSYGLDDQEFVVAFETDDPSSFLDLVAELRETQASLYTLRDTPMFTCEQMPLRAVLEAVGAPTVRVATGEPTATTDQSGHDTVNRPLGAAAALDAAPVAAAQPLAGWQRVATLAEVPDGQSKLVYCGGEAIALWHIGARVFAVANRCSHARGPLCEGTVAGLTVTCPWHGAQFDLKTGAVESGPARAPIATYAVQVSADGTISIDLTRAATAEDSAVEPNAESDLDPVDRKLLNLVQWDFPLVHRPFALLAERINAEVGAQVTDEADVMARVERLRQRTIIRQLSAIFDTRKLGYKSSLVAMRVPSEQMNEAALIINEHPGVSHNYRRDNHFNLWFTLAVPPEENLDAVLAALARRVQQLATGGEPVVVRKLPNLKMYKIAVKLDMEHDERSIDRKDQAPTYDKNPRELTPSDRRLIRAVQNDLPVTAEFFAGAAAAAGLTEDELFAWMAEMTHAGYLRRFAAILRHQEAGFTANGMITWKVPEDRVDEIGYKAAAYPQVSHCYRRPIYPDWQYNVFSMVHARSRAACEEIALKMAGDLGIDEYIILYSTHEYKKTRVEYFGNDWDAWSVSAGEGEAWAELDRRIAAGEFASGPTTWRERQASKVAR